MLKRHSMSLRPMVTTVDGGQEDCVWRDVQSSCSIHCWNEMLVTKRLEA